MATWEVKGPVVGMGKSWRNKYPELASKVERIAVPYGRKIVWEGAEIWAYKDRPKSIMEIFKSNVTKYPNEEAYVFYPGGQRMVWREIGDIVNRMAYHLKHEYKFQKGDRLCLLLPGLPEFVISFFSVNTLGGIVVPNNLGISPEGIVAQVNKVRARFMVVSPELWETKLKQIRDQLKSVEAIFMIGEKTVEGTTPFSSLIKESVAEEINEDIDEWDLCAINFTSGTTGVPKGTMTMHTNALGCAQAFVDCVKMAHNDIVLCAIPLYHNGGLYANLMPAFLLGCKLIIMASFNPQMAIEILEKEKVTTSTCPPIMYMFIMNHPEFKNHDFSSFKRIGFGGHAASEAFINQLLKEFNPIASINGGAVSESTAVGFALPIEDFIRKITSCGLATPNTEVAIFDDNGNEIKEPNKIGEVGYKGQQTNAGYWEEPEKSKETFRRDGYVLSGDWAKVDEEGYLWLLDRKKDMVVRGGQNVYCIEVENKIYLNDNVLSTAVVGVPDHIFSERLKAVVVPKPGRKITESEIREHCKHLLASYETPEYVVFAKAMPTNPAGKTLKPLLIDYWGEIAAESDDKILAKYEAYCRSMPPELMDRELIMYAGKLTTPSMVLRFLKEATIEGEKLRKIIADKGIVELLKPMEARFKD